MAIVDLGITDTILNIANSIWDKAPSPMKAVMAIFLAAAIVLMVSEAVIRPFDAISGGRVIPLLTVGGKGCDASLRPFCSPTNYSLLDADHWLEIQVADAAMQACLLPADAETQRECSAGFRWMPSSSTVHSQPIRDVLVLWRINKASGECTMLGGDASCEAACENRINTCYAPLHLAFSQPGGLGEQTISFSCAEVDYDAKMQAYQDSCNRGVYLLDARIWVFMPLTLYCVYYALVYYQATVPR